jgi:signal recognition particle receptor subunit alpha
MISFQILSLGGIQQFSFGEKVAVNPIISQLLQQTKHSSNTFVKVESDFIFILITHAPNGMDLLRKLISLWQNSTLDEFNDKFKQMDHFSGISHEQHHYEESGQQQQEESGQQESGQSIISKSPKNTAKNTAKTAGKNIGKTAGKTTSKPTGKNTDKLDYSDTTITQSEISNVTNLLDKNTLGNTQNGLYEPLSITTSSSTNKLTSFFNSIISKQLSEADITPAMSAMKEHLISKNVASQVADSICSSIATNLVGKKTSSFTSMRTLIEQEMKNLLGRIFQPNSSQDLLRDILAKKTKPYTIVFCGVNGVGKSTNLSKICFWLLQNNLRVLIAGCDTFRSGAVEQLKVHVRNLNSLCTSLSSKGQVELYERGYGKDAAGIAKEAISYANKNDFDVVLVDTAGRMQDNEPLMRALSKLMATNSPDRVLFVGEALVGNEAVDQLSKFNSALRDFSGMVDPRIVDGIVLTKFDTVDDKVGAALTMTFVSGVPILFVGTGQTYTDLKKLSVEAIVASLLK